MHGQILAPGAAPAGGPPLALAQPLNDAQLVALVAAQIYGSVERHAGEDDADAAARCAVELTALAVAAVGTGQLGRRIRELVAVAQTAPETTQA